MNLDPSYVLYLGMDGPSVNKSFEDKLLTELRDQDIQILNIGSCCLDKLYNAFRNALKQINCDFDQFAFDIHSFLNLSTKWCLKPTTELVALDVNKKANLKSLKLIQIGTKARALFASNLFCDEQQDLFRKE